GLWGQVWSFSVNLRPRDGKPDFSSFKPSELHAHVQKEPQAMRLRDVVHGLPGVMELKEDEYGRKRARSVPGLWAYDRVSAPGWVRDGGVAPHILHSGAVM